MSGKLVSGPYSVRLLSKGTKKYMLVGDLHTQMSHGMCSKDIPLFPEYLDSLFKKYPKNNGIYLLNKAQTLITVIFYQN